MNKAIEVLKSRIKYLKEEGVYRGYCGEFEARIMDERHEAQIEALEEILYELEHEDLRDEKSIPMEVVDRQHCPSCGGYLGCEGYEQKHCDECGHALLWKEI
jgi:hypothetical protein